MKRKSETGWMVTDMNGVAALSDCDPGRGVYIFKTKDAAIDNATGGKRNKRWWAGCQESGYRLVQVRVTITELT